MLADYFKKKKLEKKKKELQEILISEKAIDLIMKNGKWCSHGSDIDDYIGSEGIYRRKESDRELVTEHLHRRFDEMWEEIEKLEFPLNVKRYLTMTEDELLHSEEQSIQASDVGIYWSVNETGDAYDATPQNDKDFFVILDGNINSIDEINLVETMRSRLDWAYGNREGEINLKKETRINDLKLDIKIPKDKFSFLFIDDNKSYSSLEEIKPIIEKNKSLNLSQKHSFQSNDKIQVFNSILTDIMKDDEQKLDKPLTLKEEAKNETKVRLEIRREAKGKGSVIRNNKDETLSFIRNEVNNSENKITDNKMDSKFIKNLKIK